MMRVSATGSHSSVAKVTSGIESKQTKFALPHPQDRIRGIVQSPGQPHHLLIGNLESMASANGNGSRGCNHEHVFVRLAVVDS